MKRLLVIRNNVYKGPEVVRAWQIERIERPEWHEHRV